MSLLCLRLLVLTLTEQCAGFLKSKNMKLHVWSCVLDCHGTQRKAVRAVPNVDHENEEIPSIPSETGGFDLRDLMASPAPASPLPNREQMKRAAETGAAHATHKKPKPQLTNCTLTACHPRQPQGKHVVDFLDTCLTPEERYGARLQDIRKFEEVFKVFTLRDLCTLPSHIRVFNHV